METLKAQQEQLRLEAERSKKEQGVRVEMLEEENGKKLAEATLAELELGGDMWDFQSDFKNTVSQLVE